MFTKREVEQQYGKAIKEQANLRELDQDELLEAVLWSLNQGKLPAPSNSEAVFLNMAVIKIVGVDQLKTY